MSKKHSILPASSCERWWNCPGSIHACKNIPNPPNFYTAEGTVAHSLAEVYLRRALDRATDPDPGDDSYLTSLEERIGTEIRQDGFSIEVTEEMVDAVIAYIDYVIDLWDKCGQPEVKLEHKIELKEINAVLFGTVDCHFVVPFDVVHVFDFKYGAGKRVSAYENKQLMEYALGIMLKEDCSRFVIHVCQPRVEDGFTSYEGDSDVMHRFHKEFEQRVVKALDPKAPLVPGDWCKGTFCPNRVQCSALSGLTHKLVVKDFGEPVMPDAMTHEQIAKVLQYEEVVKDWMAKVREHAKELMIQGEEIPGFKLVESQGHAKWIDEAVVIAEFEDEVGEKLYEKQLVSPAKLEKILGKKKLGPDFRDNYTQRPMIGYKIVETSEKGEPIKTIKAQEDFQ